MAEKYVSITIDEITRGTEVRFRYFLGKQVNNVIGFVDKITKDRIFVGNESHIETIGLEIYHTKKYMKDKIENLERKILS